MVKTIGNPLSWTWGAVSGSSRYIASATSEIGGTDAVQPEVAHLTMEDLRIALRKGVDDFAAFRTDVPFIVVIYPVVGLLLAWLAFHGNLLHLIFPLVSGFTLLGPVAGVGLYELSRRRELGQNPSWGDAVGVMGSPAIGAILLLALYLVFIFVFWMLAAMLIYIVTLGPEPPAGIGAFLTDVFTTGAGWTMLILGFGVGFIFAAVVLSISLVSFPLLVDHHVGVPTAVATSIHVVQKNPRVVAAWGLLVAVSMAVASVPLLLGLIIVLPVLGHATWHLYRRAVILPAAPASARAVAA